MAAGDLLAAIMGTQQRAADSPYGLASGAIAQSTPLLVNPFDSPGRNIATSVGTGLVAALLAGLARNDANSENARIAPVMREFIGAQPDRQNELVGQYPQLAPVQGAMLASALERQQKVDEFTSMTDPEVKRQSALADALNPKKIQLAEDEAAAKIRGENAGYAPAPGASGASTNPNSPQYKYDAAIMKEEDERRKEVGALPAIAQARNMVRAIPQLDELAKIDSKTSDIPFVYQFIQSQDGTAVKEGEMLLVRGGNSLVEKYRAVFESALNGGSELTPAMKQKMVAEMRQQFRSLVDTSKLDIDRIVGIGEGRGGKRVNMLPFTDEYVNSIAPLAPQGPPAPPVDDKTRATYRQLRAQGLDPATIAKQLGIVP